MQVRSGTYKSQRVFRDRHRTHARYCRNPTLLVISTFSPQYAGLKWVRSESDNDNTLIGKAFHAIELTE